MIQTAVDYHRQGKFADAERAYRSILAQDPNQFEALHYLGVLKLQQGQAAEAESLLARAVKMRPGAVDAMCNWCGALLALARHQEALATAERILAGTPSNIQALFIRAVALMHLQRFREALAGFDQVLAIQPNHAEAVFNRGNMLAAQGSFVEALACFEKAYALNPRLLPAAYNRGNALLKLGQFADALAAFTSLLSAAPKNFDVMIGRSIALRELGRPAEALAACEEVLALDPAHRPALIARGNILLKSARAEDALACYEHLLAQRADDVEALHNRGLALKALGRHDEALESFDAGLALNPNHVDILNSRGFLLYHLRREQEGVTCMERVVAIDPERPDALAALAYGWQAICDWDRVEQIKEKLDEALAADRAIIPPHMLLQFSYTAADALAYTRRFVARTLPAMPKLPPPQPRARSGKIGLAYVSGDFRAHPVGHLVPELLERHDRAHFEVTGISFGPDDGSDIRARIVRACDQFHDVGATSNSDAAELMKKLGIDIAVDLTGHAADARIGILAGRPAPVQVSYLGLLGTMGVDHIDYILADKRVLPFDRQPFYTEKIVHLPDCFMVADSRPANSPRMPTRADVGLPETGIVFASFNHSYKFTRPVFAAWMRLLQAVKDSVLWLLVVNEATAANLAREAELNGVDPARIVFAPPVDLSDHLARQRLADLFLDTLPYNAGATGIAALWSGLPVLTMQGDGFAGRTAASMLNAMGVPELVTQNLGEYEALALKLAREPALLASLRAGLEANRSTHALFDTARTCRHVEAAYTTMWETFQRGEAPRSFALAEAIGT